MNSLLVHYVTGNQQRWSTKKQNVSITVREVKGFYKQTAVFTLKTAATNGRVKPASQYRGFKIVKKSQVLISSAL